MAFVAELLGAIGNRIFSAARALGMFLYVIFWGLGNLLRLVVAGIRVLVGRGTRGERLTAAMSDPRNIRAGLGVLRAMLPTIVIRRQLVTAFDNSATALVTAYEDVKEVVNQDEIFPAVYASKMHLLTQGGNFFLGMPAGADYLNNVSDMRLAVNRDDIAQVIVPVVEEEAAPVIAAAKGPLDVPLTLVKPVLARLLGRYFGTPGPSEAALIDWTHHMFHYIFFDFSGDPQVETAARTVSADCRGYLDDLIRDRKQSGARGDDVIDRCLRLQVAGMPAMDDVNIRNNLLGMMTAMLPTISNATCRVLDQLLSRPDALAAAQAAARGNDMALLNRYIVEAFRFNPMNPVIFRIAARDHTLAAGTLRQRKIPKGCFVFAANLSAMFDPWVINAPGRFDIDRGPEDYILWGLGLHKCFGEHISRAVMPLFLREILKMPGLRRAAGTAGRMDMAGTPFPQHLVVEWDTD